MKRSLLALAAVLVLQCGQARDDATVTPVTLKVNGLVRDWASLGKNSKADCVDVGDVLRHLRLRLDASVGDGIDVVVMPELAGGVNLLDAYAAFQVDKAVDTLGVPVTATVGQFKFPYGLNWMSTPGQLALVDYSSLATKIFNLAAAGPTNSPHPDRLQRKSRLGGLLISFCKQGKNIIDPHNCEPIRGRTERCRKNFTFLD